LKFNIIRIKEGVVLKEKYGLAYAAGGGAYYIYR
jgi:hypothetical protein